jgi:ankyrin repeat protein
MKYIYSFLLMFMLLFFAITFLGAMELSHAMDVEVTPNRSFTTFNFPRIWLELYHHFVSECNLPPEIPMVIFKDRVMVYSTLLGCAQKYAQSCKTGPFYLVCDLDRLYKSCSIQNDDALLLEMCLDAVGIGLVQIRDEYASTALHVAAHFGFVDVVTFLIKAAGENAYQLVCAHDKGRETALSKSNKVEILIALLAAAPNRDAVRSLINLPDQFDLSAWDYAQRWDKQRYRIMEAHLTWDVGSDELNNFLQDYLNKIAQGDEVNKGFKGKLCARCVIF